MLLIPLGLSANPDAGQALPGQLTDDSWIREDDTPAASPFLNETIKERMEFDDDEGSSFAVGVGDNIGDNPILKEDTTRPIDSNVPVLPNTGEVMQYQEANDVHRFEEISRSTRWGLRLSYIRDSYEYKSQNDAFDNIFVEDDAKGKKGLIFLENYRYFTELTMFRPFWSLSAGVGFNNAEGRFVNGQETGHDFTLWTLPLGASLGLEVTPLSWFKLQISAGPSLLGIIQNRGDLESNSREKEKRQLGMGYHWETRGAFSMGHIMKSRMVRLFSAYQLTGIYFDALIRGQSYTNFKDKRFAVSGLSFGLGLSFDYL